MQSDNHIEIQKDGITYLACGMYEEGNNRYISHLLKDGDNDGISYAAIRMANMLPKDKNAVLIPIPGHTGKAIQTKKLADKISEYTGYPVENILKGNNRESLYLVKKNGRSLSQDVLRFYLKSPIPKSSIPLLIDNVVDYGNTARSAIATINNNNSIIVTYSMTKNLLQPQIYSELQTNRIELKR